MTIQQKKEAELKKILSCIDVKTKESIRKIRKEQQVILSKMSEQVFKQEKALCDDEDLLVKSLVVDDLLSLEQSVD